MVSVVMAFRNEGQQVARTLESLYKSLKSPKKQIEQLVIVNDQSDDGYDYKGDINSFKEKYQFSKINYIRFASRTGAARAKSRGVMECHGDVLLIDAHMRFLNSTWVEDINNFLCEHPYTINCLNTIGFNPETEEIIDKSHSAAYLELSPNVIMCTHWSKKISNDPFNKVPLVLGASYFFRKDYFDYLRGLDGLRLWGKEEEYLSIKSWGMGDGCYILNNCKIAHLYRKIPPTVITKREVWYNILFINTVLQLKSLYKVTDSMKSHKYSYLFDSVNGQLNSYKEQVNELTEYYKVNNFDQDNFWRINNEFIAINSL